jgi:uncharacterized membrane protein YfcA
VSIVLLALPLGLATGGLLGVLGAGGSVLAVPALVYLLDQPVGAATTAALAIVSTNAAVGAAANARAGTLDAGLAVRFAAASVVGALAGSVLNRLASGETVLFLLALVMLASAWSLWRGAPAGEPAPRAATGARTALVAALGLGVGVMTGFFGVGGGFLIVPALVLLLGVPVRTAIGTSLVIIAVTALAGLAAHLAAGGVDWSVTIAFAAAGAVGAWLGVRGGRRVSGRRLSQLFALMLVAVAAFLLARNGAAVGLDT